MSRRPRRNHTATFKAKVALAAIREARTSIGRYLEFYNSIRPHSSLKALTPDQVYFNRLSEPMAA